MDELLPKHIAIIMDGNRRWARQRNLPVKLGHKEGAETLKKVVRYANKRGIQYIVFNKGGTAEDNLSSLGLEG